MKFNCARITHSVIVESAGRFRLAVLDLELNRILFKSNQFSSKEKAHEQVFLYLYHGSNCDEQITDEELAGDLLSVCEPREFLLSKYGDESFNNSTKGDINL